MRLEQMKRIADMIGLKKKSREAVCLVEIDGMTGYAASRQLDISLSTVSRAHARFRSAMKQLSS
ncbi:hypothetical protein D3C78_1232970 [compost metagenome]